MLKLCYIADVPQLEVPYTQLMYQTCGWPKIHTTPTGIHHQQQQQQHQPTTQQCNYSATLAPYFWIYNVFIDLAWYFCNHVLLMKLSCI